MPRAPAKVGQAAELYAGQCAGPRAVPSQRLYIRTKSIFTMAVAPCSLPAMRGGTPEESQAFTSTPSAMRDVQDSASCCRAASVSWSVKLIPAQPMMSAYRNCVTAGLLGELRHALPRECGPDVGVGAGCTLRGGVDRGGDCLSSVAASRCKKLCVNCQDGRGRSAGEHTSGYGGLSAVSSVDLNSSVASCCPFAPSLLSFPNGCYYLSTRSRQASSSQDAQPSSGRCQY